MLSVRVIVYTWVCHKRIAVLPYVSKNRITLNVGRVIWLARIVCHCTVLRIHYLVDLASWLDEVVSGKRNTNTDTNKHPNTQTHARTLIEIKLIKPSMKMLSFFVGCHNEKCSDICYDIFPFLSVIYFYSVFLQISWSLCNV